MTEPRTHPRRRRLHLPTLVGGLAIGAILAGAVVPLAGEHAEVASGAPTFLDGLASSTTTTTTALGGTSPAATDGGATGGAAGGSTSGGTAGGGTAGGGPGGGGTQARTASDIGVTPDAIKIGAAMAACGGCSALGVKYMSRTAGEVAKVFIDDINAKGGVNGRRIDLVVRNFDVVNDALAGTNEDRAACVDLTEREKVYAALVFASAHPDCFWDEHKVPTLTLGAQYDKDPDMFNQGQGRVWQFSPSARRSMVNLADQLVRKGLVKPGVPYAIVGGGQAGIDGPVRDNLVPQLVARGVPPAQTVYLPADAAAQPTAIANAVAVVRRQGVGTVLLLSELVAAQKWIQESERNGYRPQYLTGDLGTAWIETGASTLGSSFTGAIAVTVSAPLGTTTARSKQCKALWEAHTGMPTTDLEEATVYGICDGVNALRLALERAGTNPTRKSLAQGFASVGSFDTTSGTASYGGPYAFGPVKWSATDSYYTKRWNGQKYVSVSGPERMSA